MKKGRQWMDVTQSRFSRPVGKSLAQLLPQILDPLMRKTGFVDSSLVQSWREIAGLRLSEITYPTKLVWSRTKTKARHATLVVKVMQGFTLDVQHMLPILQERVNAHFGWACIAKIRLESGSWEPPQLQKTSPPKFDITPYLPYVSPLTEGIEDTSLREAIQRLGARVMEASTSSASTNEM